MPTCPSGHDSASTDFCDICGMRMDGAGPGAAPAPSATAAAPAPPEPAGEPCPQCGTARTGQFCEVCGFSFASGQAPQPAPPGPSAPGPSAPGAVVAGAPAAGAADGAAASGEMTPGPDGAAPPPPAAAVPDASVPDASVPGSAAPDAAAPDAAAPDAAAPGAAAAGPAAAAGWTAVVTADRAYFDSVIAAGGPDAASIEFPGYCPERRFRLTGREMRIGRRSVSRGLAPEIDLTGPPTDPGVSHLHAVLIAEPDGTWAVLDPGSSNGTIVNGNEIVSGVRVPLHDGDRVCVGAWTVVTLQGPPAT